MGVNVTLFKSRRKKGLPGSVESVREPKVLRQFTKKLPLIAFGISALSPNITGATIVGIGIDDFREVYGVKFASSDDEEAMMIDIFVTKKGQQSVFIRSQGDTGGFLKIGWGQVLLFSKGIKATLDVCLSVSLGGLLPESYERYFDFYVSGSYNLLQLIADQQYHGTINFNIGVGPVYIGYTYVNIDDVYSWDMENETYHYVAGKISYFSLGVNFPPFIK